LAAGANSQICRSELKQRSLAALPLQDGAEIEAADERPGVKLAADPTVSTLPSGSSTLTSRVGDHEPSSSFLKASQGMRFVSGPGPSVGAGAVSARAWDATNRIATQYRRLLIRLVTLWAGTVLRALTIGQFVIECDPMWEELRPSFLRQITVGRGIAMSDELLFSIGGTSLILVLAVLAMLWRV